MIRRARGNDKVASHFPRWDIARARSGLADRPVGLRPSVVFHAAHNGMLGFNNVLVSTEKTDLYADETGTLLAVCGVMLAVLFTVVYSFSARNIAAGTIPNQQGH